MLELFQRHLRYRSSSSLRACFKCSEGRIEFVYEFVVLCVESDEYSYLTKYAINGRKKTKSRVASATLQLAPASREAVVTTKARYDEKREFLQVPKKEYLADSPPEGKEELHDELRLLETLRNTCPYCDKHFDDVYKVERHVENVHKRPYKCDLCPKAYVKAYKLRAHKKTHSETFYFECSICHLKYKMELSLKHHHIRVHSNCDFNFTCDHCGKRFKLKGDLLAHIGRTHMCDMQICRFCGKTVKDLKNHELRHQEIVKKYACHLCNKKFKTQTMLDNHLLLHKDGFKCHECGKKCSGPTALYNHKNIHHKPATLTCTVCGKIFSASNHFYQHVLTHAGLKPYRCDICNADFTQRTSLMRHRKTHPGTLPPPPPISIVKLAKNVLQSL